MKIGKKLTLLRKEKKITLKELSERSGVQIATLSRMEHDIMTGTLASHVNICKALGVSLADFYREIEDGHKTVAFVGQKESHKPLVHPKDSAIEMLTTKFSAKNMMPVLIRIKKDARIAQEKCPPDTEKFLYLLEGRIRAIIGKDEYKMRRGDSIYFDASLFHIFYNIAKIESLLLSVFSPGQVRVKI